jgi:hypothetical protein
MRIPMAATATAIAGLACAGLASAALAFAPAAQAAPAAHGPKRHYIGSCAAQGSYPICTIDARTAYDVRHVYVHVWGHLSIPGRGRGRVEDDYDNLCEKGTGSGSDSGTIKAFPSYVRALKQAYKDPSHCFADGVFSPVSDAATGSIHATMYYTRRDGR